MQKTEGFRRPPLHPQSQSVGRWWGVLRSQSEAYWVRTLRNDMAEGSRQLFIVNQQLSHNHKSKQDSEINKNLIDRQEARQDGWVAGQTEPGGSGSPRNNPNTTRGKSQIMLFGVSSNRITVIVQQARVAEEESFTSLLSPCRYTSVLSV